MAAATGAIWKCSSVIFRKNEGDSSISSLTLDPQGTGYMSSSPDIMSTEGIINLLVTLLVNQPEEVLVNVAGALYEIAKADLEYNAPLIKKAQAIKPLMALLTRSNTVCCTVFVGFYRM